MCLSADWTGASPPSPPPVFAFLYFCSTFATFATLRFRSIEHLQVSRCACPQDQQAHLVSPALFPPCLKFVRLRASMSVCKLSEFTHTLSSLCAWFCGVWLGPCLSAVHARACSCLPWMSFLRLAPPMLFSGCPPLMVLRCSSLLCRWFCLLAWLPFVAFVAWVLAVLPALSWLPLSLPSPRGCPWVFSGPASVLLVPPSGFLVVSATVWLSYLWHGVSWPIGSCPHSASWQQRLRPCVGLCPLHHGVGVVHVPFAPALRYSPSGDPESP